MQRDKVLRGYLQFLFRVGRPRNGFELYYKMIRPETALN
jgi:hypothetical protein